MTIAKALQIVTEKKWDLWCDYSRRYTATVWKTSKSPFGIEARGADAESAIIAAVTKASKE